MTSLFRVIAPVTVVATPPVVATDDDVVVVVVVAGAADAADAAAAAAADDDDGGDDGDDDDDAAAADAAAILQSNAIIHCKLHVWKFNSINLAPEKISLNKNDLLRFTGSRVGEILTKEHWKLRDELYKSCQYI